MLFSVITTCPARERRRGWCGGCAEKGRNFRSWDRAFATWPFAGSSPEMRHQERGMTASQLQPENPSPSVPNAGHGIDPGQALSQAQTQFFIPATASLHERRPRTLKHGDSFAVFDHSGDAIDRKSAV